jgi:hypothetical protein
MSARNPDAPAGDKPKRLTADQIERIVELAILGHPYRVIAKDVGCNVDTVARRWHEWQDATLEGRRENRERDRTTVIAQLTTVSTRALQAADNDTVSGSADHARMLNVARGALSDLSRVAGFDAPRQVKLDASVHQMTEAEAQAILDRST